MPASLLRQLPAPTFRLPAPGWDAARRMAAFGLLAMAVAWSHREVAGAVSAWLARPAPQAPAAAPRPGWVLVPGPAGANARPAAAAAAALPVWLPQAPAARADRPSTRIAAGRPAASVARPPSPTAQATAIAAAPHEVATAAQQPAPQADQPAGAAAQWPTHVTHPPPAATLQFRLQRGALSGSGLWQWAQDGQHYQLHLQADLGGRALLDHVSQGGFDAAGLAPLRMVEQQRGRAVRAVNFQRDKTLISFSGSAQTWALARGAQDRVSWLPQMMALVAGQERPWSPGAELVLPVAGPRGDLDLWQFQLLETGPQLGEAALHWQRQPARPYDARVDLWLAQQAPHWPLAWQWQVVPGGEAVRWERVAPGEPPAAP